MFSRVQRRLSRESDLRRWVGFDGKVVRGSFDHFQDQKAIQVLSAFLTDSRLILAHEEITGKTNEIPTAQALFSQLGLSNCIFTFDPCTARKKRWKRPARLVMRPCAGEGESTDTLPGLSDDCTNATPRGGLSRAGHQNPRPIESRKVEVFIRPSLTHADKWSLVEAVVKVDRHRLVFDTKTKCWHPSDETAFYISTTVLKAQSSVRGSAGIGASRTGDHHVRD